MRFRTLLLALAFPVTFWGAATDFPGVDDKWLFLESANFELYSRNRESDSRELLHNLELLRAVFLDTLKLTERRRLPVTVYYFKSEKDFRAYVSEDYGTKHTFTGFYVGGVDRAVIYLMPGEDALTTRQMIFHEYIHHLFRVAEQNPPSWFNEGMAELFSTVETAADRLELGRPSPGRLWQLQADNMMSLEKLFAVDHNSEVFRQGEHTGLFYAESWVLVHYLYFGDSKIPPAKRSAFLHQMVDAGGMEASRLRALFNEIFGMDYPAMLSLLQFYVRGGSYYGRKYPLPVVPPAKGYALRSVPLAEISVRLAELALRVDHKPLAKLALLQVAENSPEFARVQEVLGSDAVRDGDWDRAAERWDRALAAGTTNPAVLHELALHEGRQRFSHFDLHYRLPDEAAARLRDLLARSIAAAPQQTGAYETLAWVEATAREPQVRSINLVQKTLPGLKEQNRTLLALAVAHMRLGDKPGAAEMLDVLEKSQPDDWVRYGIEHTRAELEGRPVDRSKLPTARRSGSPGVDVPIRISKPSN